MSADKYQNRPYEWFASRVGKKVYRKIKRDSSEVLIRDEAHACFLFDEQLESKIKYSEEK